MRGARGPHRPALGDHGGGRGQAPHAVILGATYGAWLPPLVDGEAPRAIFGGPPPNENELLINADIEPDADGDGFGDETQDLCPADGSTQGPCPPDTDPPQTRITKGAPGKTELSRVKFRFRADEPGSTFECKLDWKKFRPCVSPKAVKGLEAGEHRFKVRAIDAAGNVDPTPARDKFKVVG